MMATTKIWAIKDSLSRVVNYAKNPDKTLFTNLKQVLKYAENDEKTIDKNEKTMYVTGVNCNRETAYEEMMNVQKRFNKTTGNVAYHAYQSFKTGEVTPEIAHKIGVELAEKMFPEQQVLVATHFNTGTYHNHFVINSVNMFTGKKFNCNKGAYYKFRGISDSLCEKYNLVVIKNPRGNTPRNIYFQEKRGEPTMYNLMRKAIDESLEMSITTKQFKNVLRRKGYIINDNPNRKYVTIRSICDKKATRLYRLGEGYNWDDIVTQANTNPFSYQNRYSEFMKERRQYFSNKNQRTYKYKGNCNDIKGVSILEAVFIVLFYLMGVYPTRQEPNRPRHTPLSPEMKKAIIKMDRYSEQVRLVGRENLKTIEDVEKYIKDTEEKVTATTNVRQKYRNKLRNCKDETQIKELKEKRNLCTSALVKYRNNIKIAKQVIEDLPEIKETISIEKQTYIEQRELELNKNKDRGMER